jgi:hypothetical protein
MFREIAIYGSMLFCLLAIVNDIFCTYLTRQEKKLGIYDPQKHINDNLFNIQTLLLAIFLLLAARVL